MSLVDMTFIAVCLFGGYWLVSSLIEAQERKALRKNAQPEQPAAQARDTAPDWATVLGVPSSASFDEVRMAYKRRMAEYHPDKVATLGEELRELAAIKAQEINAAYEAARKAHGQ